MEFLKGYSAILVSGTTCICLLNPSDSSAFIGGLMFIPVSVYLGKMIIDKKI